MSDIGYKMVQVRTPVHKRLTARKRTQEKVEGRTVTFSEIIRDGLDALDQIDENRAGVRRYGS